MRTLHRTAVAWLCSAAALGAAAAQPALPPLDGQLSGTFVAKVWPGAPALRWTLAVAAGEPGRRMLTATAEGTGTRLRLTADVSEANGAGEWRLERGELDLAAWWPALAPGFGEVLKGTTATGTLELSGAGRLRRGVPAGQLKVRLRDGGLRHEADGWALAGLAWTGDFHVDAAEGSARSDGPFELTLQTITTPRFGARNLLVRALLEPGWALTVREARLEIAGGDASLDPCTVPLAPFALDVKLRLVRVGLQDVVALVPEVLAEARGRVDGSVGLRWSPGGGLALGAGHFAVRQDEPAEVRLAPTPGLISGSLPAEALKYYPGLGQIETGQVPLRAEVLEVTFQPEGDSEGRTARVRLAGGPVDPRLRAPIDLTVNVRGPLELLVRFGTSSQLSFGGGR